MSVSAILPSTGETTSWLHDAGVRIGIVPCERLRATLNPFRHLKYLVKFPGTMAAYKRAVRELQPDIVHVDCFLNLPALVAARLSGRRTLLHIQEVPSGVGRLLACFAGLLADRVVAVSEAAARPLRRSVASSKLAVVYNGTAVPPAQPAYAPAGYVAFFGRISEDRDPISFVRAAQAVYGKAPSARFLLCGLTVPGRKRDEARLENLIAQTAIPPEQFLFVRNQEDTAQLLTQCSIVVSCLAAEGFGLAVLEAMAAAKPVVVPRSGAFPEYIRDGETGLFYSPGDVQALANCILRLLRDPHLAEQLGRAARRLVEDRFTSEHMAAGIEREYRQLLAAPPVLIG